MSYQNASEDTTGVAGSYENSIGLWACRCLLDLNIWRNMSGYPHVFTNDASLLSVIGLRYLEDQDIAKRKFLKRVQERHDFYEAHVSAMDGALKENVEKFASTMGLNSVEQEILIFSALLQSSEGLIEATSLLGDHLTADNINTVLSVLLRLDMNDVRRAMNAKSLLSQSGLLHIDRRHSGSVDRKLELMDGLQDVLFEPCVDILDMLNDYFHVTSEGTLLKQDFDHINDDVQVIEQYLKRALRDKKVGVNILLYGIAGVGKSQLARILTDSIGAASYEISTSDEEGDALRGDRRFSSYQLSQKILAKKEKSIILFDEIEDVFPKDVLSLFGLSSAQNKKKAWINRLLEENTVPAIWISNEVEQIDDAFLRRFDCILELKIPRNKCVNGF